MGFVVLMNFLCADLPFEIAIKSGTPMGFVNLQTSYAPLSLLKEMKSKKAQHLRRCVPCYVLTQGSSLCSPTLGYQKQNPYGVRLSHELPLRPLFLLTRDEIKKAQHLRRCVPLNVLTQGSPLCSPTLGYQKRNPYGVRLSCKHPLPALPSP